MSESIVDNEQVCFICKTPMNLHKHHVFNGTANRKKSEEDGAWVYLCMYHHTGSKTSVHQCQDADEWLKRYTQRIWEKRYKVNHEDDARLAFIKRYGRSYL